MRSESVPDGPKLQQIMGQTVTNRMQDPSNPNFTLSSQPIKQTKTPNTTSRALSTFKTVGKPSPTQNQFKQASQQIATNLQQMLNQPPQQLPVTPITPTANLRSLSSIQDYRKYKEESSSKTIEDKYDQKLVQKKQRKEKSPKESVKVRKLQNPKKSTLNYESNIPHVQVTQLSIAKEDGHGNQKLKSSESLKQDLLLQQKSVWQQLQILKLLRNEGSQQTKGIIQGQITHQYGFQLSEEEMYERIFCYHQGMKNNPMYAQLECIECLKLTNKMLHDETRLIVQNRKRQLTKLQQIQSQVGGASQRQTQTNKISNPAEVLECVILGGSIITSISYDRRPKSNFGTSRCNPNIFTDITIEQAMELVKQNPQVFMTESEKSQSFIPIVKGRQIIANKKVCYRLVFNLPDPRVISAVGQQVPLQKQTGEVVIQTQKQQSIPAHNTVQNIQKKMKTRISEDLELMHNHFDGRSKNDVKEYGPSKLNQSKLNELLHLRKSVTNQTIQKVNQVVMSLFKQKVKIDDLSLIALLKFFNIPVPKGNGTALDYAELKKPDFLYTVNMKLMQKLNKVLNFENNQVKPEQGSNYFKFYVGTGNNHPSVRQIISRRSWWHRVKKERFIGQTGTDYISDEEDEDNSAKGAHFIWTQWRKTELSEQLKLSSDRQLIYNKLENNYHLANKKALFINISNYYKAINLDPFEVAIPLTFHIKSQNDPEYKKFIEMYNKYQNDKSNSNIWIIKPGENSNRGTGIQVAQNLHEIKQIINSLAISNGNRTSIVQKYLEKPLLINGRKFDIRTYAMITSINGVLKGYMYRDCYFRTSSKPFDLTNLQSRFIHLTNDAVQVNSEDYGKFENANKLSINDFQRYLDQNHSSKSVCFMRDLFPMIERLVTDSFRAVYQQIDPSRGRNSFEIFGYDFMIDENFQVYLIEANTNPCLEICCPLLARIIPELLDNSFRIAVDPIYQPPALIDDKNQATEITPKPRSCGLDINQFMFQSEEVKHEQKFRQVVLQNKEQNIQTNKNRRRFELMSNIKYTLVFDEHVDAPELEKLFGSNKLIANQQLLAEIVEEEKICEIEAKQDEKKARLVTEPDEEEDDVPQLFNQSDSDN